MKQVLNLKKFVPDLGYMELANAIRSLKSKQIQGALHNHVNPQSNERCVMGALMDEKCGVKFTGSRLPPSGAFEAVKDKYPILKSHTKVGIDSWDMWSILVSLNNGYHYIAGDYHY